MSHLPMNEDLTFLQGATHYRVKAISQISVFPKIMIHTIDLNLRMEDLMYRI